MKKLYTLTFILMASLSFGQTVYTENIGTPSATTLVTAYTGWQNPAPIIYTGNGDVRPSTASSGYIGASGSGNVWFATTAPIRFFQIEGINTSSYSSAQLVLKFGYLTSNIANHLLVEQSIDGTTWTPITYTQNTTIAWTLVTVPGGVLQSTANLRLRFTQTLQTVSHRLDDINISVFCNLNLGTELTACNASTLNLDTYNVTIPFTGGNTGTYNLAVNAGTIGGDNPSSMATGNVIISNVPEGTNLTLTVTGSCGITRSVNSPECKPINALPYTENFNYTVGNSLGAEQMWTNVNSGNNVLAFASNLTYPGVISSGNSVIISGAGIDPFTPFTTTSSGTIYYSFLINVVDMANVTTDLTQTYFAGLTDSEKSYMARLFIKKNGTQYQLGFDSASTTANYDATLRNVGDVVLVIMGYDFGTNGLKAWLNPDLTTFTNATPATLTNTPAVAIANLGGFILRQDNATSTPRIIIDELRIGAAVLSVNDNSIAGLKMYPNPVSENNLYISSDANSVKNVTIYDIIGKQVLNTKISSEAINVSNLNSGVYVVKITEDGKTATRKLVIK